MFLLDTSVLSEGQKPRPDPIVSAWLKVRSPQDIFLSVITVGEIQRGAASRAPGELANKLAAWLADEVLPRFAERILPIDVPTALVWGELVGSRLRAGRPVSVADSLIAATAAWHRLTVVTRNVDDFVACGVPVLNPWDPT